MSERLSATALRLASAATLLLTWQLLAWLLADPLLPSPLEVIAMGWRETLHGPLLGHLAATLRRVVLAFLIAMLIGSAIGILMGRSRTADLLLDPWLILMLNLPALVVIVLGYVWFGLLETTAVLAIAANKIPNVVVTLREGARVLDRELLEMAHSFRLGWRKTLFRVTLPRATAQPPTEANALGAPPARASGDEIQTPQNARPTPAVQAATPEEPDDAP